MHLLHVKSTWILKTLIPVILLKCAAVQAISLNSPDFTKNHTETSTTSTLCQQVAAKDPGIAGACQRFVETHVNQHYLYAKVVKSQDAENLLSHPERDTLYILTDDEYTFRNPLLITANNIAIYATNSPTLFFSIPQRIPTGMTSTLLQIQSADVLLENFDIEINEPTDAYFPEHYVNAFQNGQLFINNVSFKDSSKRRNTFINMDNGKGLSLNGVHFSESVTQPDDTPFNAEIYHMGMVSTQNVDTITFNNVTVDKIASRTCSTYFHENSFDISYSHVDVGVYEEDGMGITLIYTRNDEVINHSFENITSVRTRLSDHKSHLLVAAVQNTIGNLHLGHNSFSTQQIQNLANFGTTNDSGSFTTGDYNYENYEEEDEITSGNDGLLDVLFHHAPACVYAKYNPTIATICPMQVFPMPAPDPTTTATTAKKTTTIHPTYIEEFTTVIGGTTSLRSSKMLPYYAASPTGAVYQATSSGQWRLKDNLLVVDRYWQIAEDYAVAILSTWFGLTWMSALGTRFDTTRPFASWMLNQLTLHSIKPAAMQLGYSNLKPISLSQVASSEDKETLVESSGPIWKGSQTSISSKHSGIYR